MLLMHARLFVCACSICHACLWITVMLGWSLACLNCGFSILGTPPAIALGSSIVVSTLLFHQIAPDVNVSVIAGNPDPSRPLKARRP